jgi:predicted transcriptional regulator
LTRGDGKGLAGELDRDPKSVHRKVATLTATGAIERRADEEVVGRKWAGAKVGPAA